MMRILLCSVGVMALATGAAAQDVPANGNGGQTDNQAVLGEVIVTAARRAETAQRSALSIQALSGERLTRAGVTRPEDLNTIAPGVAVATGGNFPVVYIRGVGNFAANSQAESAVAWTLDGVYISRPLTTRGMFYDLERLEVLKGPQGTLYGRNASGGAINVITAKPKLGETGGFAEVQAGDYEMIQGAAAVNVPLGDTVALRLSGQAVGRDGYMSDGYSDDKTQSARLQLLWKPNDDVSLLLNGNYQHLGGMGTGSALKPQLPGEKFRGSADPAVRSIIQAQPGLGPLLIYPKTDGFVDMNLYTVGAELNLNVGFATLTVIPAYRRSDYRDLGYVPGFSVSHAEIDDQSSVEFRLGNSDPKLKWVLGGFFFDEEIGTPKGEPAQVARQGVSTFVVDTQSLSTRSAAAFAQATYSLTDRLRATGGLRYTYERKTLSDFLHNYSLPAPPPAPPGACPAGVFDVTSPDPPRFCRLTIDDTGAAAGRLTYNNVTYKAGLEFDLAPRSMAYANLSTGFKSGGFFSAPPPNTFRPEKLTAFDAGVKNRFLDNRLQVNVEAFYWRYRDHQETSVGPTAIPGFFALLTKNASRATSYGADLDVVFRATSQDELSFKAQYNKTRYDSFTFTNDTARFGPPATGCAVGPLANGLQTVDCSGKALMRAPLWTGTAGYSHDFDLGDRGKVTASLEAQFSSSYYGATDFLPIERQASFIVGNFDLVYTSPTGRFVFAAFVRNITNEAVYTQAFRYPFVNSANPLANPQGLVLGALRPPRMFGGRIRVNF